MLDVYRWSGQAVGGIVLLFMCSVLIVGCGTGPITSTTSSSSNTNANATATACVQQTQFRTAVGTLQSVSDTTLMINDAKGNSVKATYTTNTRFMRQALVANTALKEGTFVIVAVSQNADNTYSATRITIANQANGNGNAGGVFQRRNANANCPRPNRPNGNRGNGTPRANGNGNARAITGMVGQLNGNTLTVTEANGSDYTATLTKDTLIMQTTEVTAKTLQTGMNISILGTSGSQGVIAAQVVTILLPGANGRPNIGG